MHLFAFRSFAFVFNKHFFNYLLISSFGLHHFVHHTHILRSAPLNGRQRTNEPVQPLCKNERKRKITEFCGDHDTMGHAKSRLIFGRKQSYADVEEWNPVDLQCRFLFIKLWNNIQVYYAMPSKLPQLLIEWKITLFKKESIEKCSNTNKKLWECQISIWTTTLGKCNNQMNKYRLNWPSAIVCQHFHLLGNYKFARFYFRFFYVLLQNWIKKNFCR